MSKVITLGGEKFTLSAVPLIGLAKLGEKITLIGKDFSEDSVEALIDGVYFGVKRNHPEVERSFFEWNIDTSNLKEVLSAFVEVNQSEGEPTAGKRKAKQ